MSPYIGKRLWRRPILLVVNILFCILFCGLLCYLFGYMDRQRQELERVQESYDVPCVVSSIQGSSTTGLRIRQDYLQVLADPALEDYAYACTRDFQLTKEFSGKKVRETDSEEEDDELLVIGLTNPELAPVLDETLGAQVVWAEQIDFYSSCEPLCLVSQQVYQTLEMEQPFRQLPELTITLKDPMRVHMGSVEVTLTAVGFHTGDASTVYLPWDYAQRLMEDTFHYISCDSLRFYVRDNNQIDELYDRVKDWFQPVDIQGGDTLYSYALTIYDEQYRSTVAALQQNINRSQYTIPVLLTLVVLSGALVSFLSTRSERRSYALMRVQGLNRAGLTGTIIAELAIPAVGGCVLSAVACRQLLPVGIFLACYLLGGMAAALRLVLDRPAVILRQQE